MPLTRFGTLAELIVSADDAIPQPAGQRSSGGAMRSANARANRSARRKSPYSAAATTPLAPSGVSPALEALGVGSVTRARSTKWRTVAVPVPEPAQLPVPVLHGAGGARGPLERQLEKEAKFSSKRAADLARLSRCGDDPAGSLSRASPPKSSSPRKSPRKKSMHASHLGGRSVEQWVHKG